ncbi:hypothetical protein CWE17_07170 [Synechococcus sp. BS56D]|nr:hypothetical protein CWE17_07170 [Synechococcus sp. BS56D]
MIKNKLADNQQLLVIRVFSDDKAASTGDQRVNARKLTLQVTELIQDDFADIADAGQLLMTTARNCCRTL